MEFLSETDAEEYSNRSTFPYGKLYYYEQILKFPSYIIFDPSLPMLEVRQLHSGTYVLLQPNEQGRYYKKTSANWLRWWDYSGNMLLWGSEEIAIAQQAIEQEQQQAELEHQRATHLEAELNRYRKQFGVFALSPNYAIIRVNETG